MKPNAAPSPPKIPAKTLDRLRLIVEAEARRELSDDEHRKLKDVMCLAVDLYRVTPRSFSKYMQSSLSGLAKIDRPLALVIDVIERQRALVASIFGNKRQKALVADLRSLHRLATWKRPSGRPGQSSDLYAVVVVLAAYWVNTTGKRFTRDWHGSSPLTPAMIFVHTAIAFIDAGRLPELPTITKEVVRAGRAAA